MVRGVDLGRDIMDRKEVSFQPTTRIMNINIGKVGVTSSNYLNMYKHGILFFRTTSQVIGRH